MGNEPVALPDFAQRPAFQLRDAALAGAVGQGNEQVLPLGPGLAPLQGNAASQGHARPDFADLPRRTVKRDLGAGG